MFPVSEYPRIEITQSLKWSPKLPGCNHCNHCHILKNCHHALCSRPLRARRARRPQAKSCPQWRLSYRPEWTRRKRKSCLRGRSSPTECWTWSERTVPVSQRCWATPDCLLWTRHGRLSFFPIHVHFELCAWSIRWSQALFPLCPGVGRHGDRSEWSAHPSARHPLHGAFPEKPSASWREANIWLFHVSNPLKIGWRQKGIGRRRAGAS